MLMRFIADAIDIDCLGTRLKATVLQENMLSEIQEIHMDVEPKIVGKPPKWMVKIMENPIKMG